MVHERNDGKTHEKDEARTPMSLFIPLDAIYHFELDAAATPANALCPGYYTKEDNALAQPWYEDYGEDGCVKSIWCNPPYSHGNVEPFCKKAYEESLEGALVAMLLPMDSSTRWFHKYCSKAYKWIIYKPRVKFDHPNGIPFEGSPKFGSLVCVFDEAGRRSLSSPLIEFRSWK